jgi:hypothetical protein
MAATSIFIQPKSPSVPEIVKQSPIDQFTVRIYIPGLLFFKLSPDVSHNDICSQLQHGVRGLLDDMPFLADNIEEDCAERGTLQLEIPDNASVLFKIKDLTHPRNGP